MSQYRRKGRELPKWSKVSDRVNDARMERHVRIKQVNPGAVVLLEPGREFEQLFTGGDDPLNDAIQYAAKMLRGEIDPTSED